MIDREARFVYAADRFDDIIATFAISAKDGKLTLLNRISCGGNVPRHIALDPEWALAARGEPGFGQYCGAELVTRETGQLKERVRAFRFPSRSAWCSLEEEIRMAINTFSIMTT